MPTNEPTNCDSCASLPPPFFSCMTSSSREICVRKFYTTDLSLSADQNIQIVRPRGKSNDKLSITRWYTGWMSDIKLIFIWSNLGCTIFFIFFYWKINSIMNFSEKNRRKLVFNPFAEARAIAWRLFLIIHRSPETNEVHASEKIWITSPSLRARPAKCLSLTTVYRCLLWYDADTSAACEL